MQTCITKMFDQIVNNVVLPLSIVIFSTKVVRKEIENSFWNDLPELTKIYNLSK